MFRLNAVANFRVRLPSGQLCSVRYPSDTEWADRMRQLKLVRRPLGRDKFLSEMPGRVPVDAALFAKIRQDQDGPPFDDYEAAAVIDEIDACRVVEITREGPHFHISMEDARETVIHVLRIPTQREKADYERADTRLISGRRSQEITAYLEPAANLWDAISIRTEGYAGAVPILHKYAAVREVLNEIAECATGVELDDPEPSGPSACAA